VLYRREFYRVSFDLKQVCPAHLYPANSGLPKPQPAAPKQESQISPAQPHCNAFQPAKNQAAHLGWGGLFGKSSREEGKIVNSLLQR
jgi:hypothetical protein